MKNNRENPENLGVGDNPADTSTKGNGHSEFLQKCDVVIEAALEVAKKKGTLKEAISGLQEDEGIKVLRYLQEQVINGKIPPEALEILGGREFLNRSDYVKLGLSFKAVLEKIPEKIQKELGITSRVTGFNAEKIWQTLIARGEAEHARDFQMTWPEIWRIHKQSPGETNSPFGNSTKEKVSQKLET